MVFLRSEEIAWIEASANYRSLSARSEVHQLEARRSSDFERLLPKEKFLRIHRTRIDEPLDAIAERAPCGDREHVVILRSEGATVAREELPAKSDEGGAGGQEGGPRVINPTSLGASTSGPRSS